MRGPVEARSGRVVDLELLDGLVRRQVLEPFDHRNLNEEVAAFRAAVPTSENLGREMVTAVETELACRVSGGRAASRTGGHRRDQPQRL